MTDLCSAAGTKKSDRTAMFIEAKFPQLEQGLKAAKDDLKNLKINFGKGLPE